MHGIIGTYTTLAAGTLELTYSARAGALAIRRAADSSTGQPARSLLQHIIDHDTPLALWRELHALWTGAGLPAGEGSGDTIGRLTTRRALLAFMASMAHGLEADAQALLSAKGRKEEAQDSLYLARNTLALLDAIQTPPEDVERVRQALLRVRHELAVGLLQDLLTLEQRQLYREGRRQEMSEEAQAAVGEAEVSFEQWVVQILLDEDVPLAGARTHLLHKREAAIIEAAFRYPDRATTQRDMSLLLQAPSNPLATTWLLQLERWWLSVYDVGSYTRAHVLRSAIEACPAKERPRIGKLESLYHPSRGAFLTALAVMALPFVMGMAFYDGYAEVFDVWVAAMMVVIYAAGAWFLVWRFLVQRNITFFNLAIPRLLASIVVGYVPLLVVDDSWHLALKMDPPKLLVFCPMMLLLTFLYLVIETRHRLGDMRLAMARALDLLLMGLVQALAIGLVTCNLVAGVMFERFDWDLATPSLGQMPTTVGETVATLGLTTYPVVLLVFTCGSLFIGIFLQLLWEEKQLTEPV